MKRIIRILAIVGLIGLLCACSNTKAEDSSRLTLNNPKQFRSEDGVYELCGVHWGSDLKTIEEGLSIDLDEEPYLAGDWLKVYQFMDRDEKVGFFGYDANFSVEIQNDGPQLEEGLTQITMTVTFSDGAEPVSGFEIFDKIYPKLAKELGEAEVKESANQNSKTAVWEHDGEYKSALQFAFGEDYFVCMMGVLGQRQ